MTRYLVFQVAGPLASWGDVAVGENRPSGRGPTKSAIIGLLAGSNGVDRCDQERLDEITRDLGLGAATVRPGTVLRDFHTSQVPPKVALMHSPHANRREELLALTTYNRDRGVSTGTILSIREYLCDAAWLVAIWLRDGARSSLEDLADGLARPHFIPYLGRKSCPAMFPFAAEIVDAETIVEAFERSNLLDAGQAARTLAESDQDLETLRLEWDVDGRSGVDVREQSRRRDVPRSRRNWQFEEREVCVGRWFRGGEE